MSVNTNGYPPDWDSWELPERDYTTPAGPWPALLEEHCRHCGRPAPREALEDELRRGWTLAGCELVCPPCTVRARPGEDGLAALYDALDALARPVVAGDLRAAAAAAEGVLDALAETLDTLGRAGRGEVVLGR
jgi:hypothetical protein